MKRGLLLVTLVAGVLLLLVPAASAQSTGWYWTRAAAENYILNKMTTSDGEDITDVTCVGLGRAWRPHGVTLWHRFRCDENDDLDREFTVILSPRTRYHASAVEINCDDSYSDSSCP
jgi:hypothetical protein